MPARPCNRTIQPQESVASARRALQVLVISLLAFLLTLPAPVRAADDVRPPTGLMWHRSGLPAVFPLQIKTTPGRDYRVSLLEPETGREILAAYIRSGDFFKVLVPPGTFKLRLAAGKGWQGEKYLLGDDTEVIELPEPLTFEVRGTSAKAGHLVDLTDPASGTLARVKDQVICQASTTEFTPPPHERRLDAPLAAARIAESGWLREAQGLGLLEAEVFLRFNERYPTYPRQVYRSRYCE